VRVGGALKTAHDDYCTNALLSQLKGNETPKQVTNLRRSIEVNSPAAFIVRSYVVTRLPCPLPSSSEFPVVAPASREASSTSYRSLARFVFLSPDLQRASCWAATWAVRHKRTTR
jgi:hypothetical protein